MSGLSLNEIMRPCKSKLGCWVAKGEVLSTSGKFVGLLGVYRVDLVFKSLDAVRD